MCVTIVLARVGELSNVDALGTIVCKQRFNTRNTSAAGALDLDISAVGVELSVADGVVPQPHEGGLARGSTIGDLDWDGIRRRGIFQALTDQGLDDDPGFTIVVRQCPLAVSTAVRSSN